MVSEFQGMVHSCFSFLISDLGYSLVADDDNWPGSHVQFSSDSLEAHILFHRNELEMWIETRAPSAISIDLAMALDMEAPNRSGPFASGHYLTSEPDKAVAAMVELCKDHILDILAGNDLAITNLIQYQARVSEDNSQILLLTQARSQASVAWQSGDFNGYVQTLAEFQPYLKKSELMKMEIARRRIGVEGG